MVSLKREDGLETPPFLRVWSDLVFFERFRKKALFLRGKTPKAESDRLAVVQLRLRLPLVARAQRHGPREARQAGILEYLGVSWSILAVTVFETPKGERHAPVFLVFFMVFGQNDNTRIQKGYI